MHEIDGIRISDVGYDRVCLNCIFWKTNVQLNGPPRALYALKAWDIPIRMIRAVCFRQIAASTIRT